MSSDLALSVRGLSKSFSIGTVGQGTTTLGEALSSRLRNPWRRAQSETFWALRDVSFEVRSGEVLGVIGRNGAGKSTLLKLLSQIIEPTKGEIDLYGRVGSLLEVGTGFHPELTGRENIFLNGAILGMRRREIERQFDEIVAFAEIEQFLDTPVKRYSSGMYVRLAFAVAAHLTPDILIVDEVLAVGDAHFQKKCLGKIEEVGSGGRTVLFVSHSMPVVLRLCQRVLMLDQGRVVIDGTPEEAAAMYLGESGGSSALREWPEAHSAPGNSVARLKAVRVLDEGGVVAPSIDIERDCFIEIEYWCLGEPPRAAAAFHLLNEDGIVLFASVDFSTLSRCGALSQSQGEKVVRARCRIPGNLLAEGRCTVLAALCSYNPNVVHAREPDAAVFQVVDRSQGSGARGCFAGADWPGVVRPLLQWEVDGEISR